MVDKARQTKQHRTRAACNFCRKRKLRCDNGRPRCANCLTYDKVCEYAGRSEQPRPTRSRIRQLEERNRQLVSRLKATGSGTIDVAYLEHGETVTDHSLIDDGADTHESPRVGSPPERVNTLLHHVQERHTEPNYYGTTSTLFNDERPSLEPTTTQIQRRRTSTSTNAQNALIAAAAKQKQLENFNYNAGKLDFDGVDPDLGMHLLQLHWARQHHSFLVTYRPAFMRDMACGGPYFSKLLLNAIYFGAAKFSQRLEVRRDSNDVRTAGWQYRNRVRDLLGNSLDKSEVTTIQALLILSNSLFALGDERSAAWLYVGIAIRMIIDLGMHVDIEGTPRGYRLTDEDIELRRRVFWGAFVIDKVQSLYQGRPASLQDFDTRVSLRFLDTYEEFEYWLPFAHTDSAPTYPGSPAYSTSTFTELCRLSIILSKVLNKMYSEKARGKEPAHLLRDQRELYAELRSWRRALPAHLDFDAVESNTHSPPPHVLSLLAMYEVVLVVLHRPFVSEGHLYSKDDPTVASNCFSVCASAATAIVNLIRAYDRDFSIKRAPYLIAYATYVAATIHTRIAAQSSRQSRSYSMLSTCLGVFAQNRETNWAVRRAEMVIMNLMKNMEVALNNDEMIGPQLQYGSHPQAVAADSHQPSRAPISTTTSDPEIDIDMIIQSFRPERDTGLHQAQAVSNLNNVSSEFIPATTRHAPHDEDSIQIDYSALIDSSINDPLFGFYGSPSDNQWLYDLGGNQNSLNI